MDNDNEVRKVLLELFEQEELVDEWLNNPKCFFNDLTPLEVLQKTDGEKEVLIVLNRIRYGDFS